MRLVVFSLLLSSCVRTLPHVDPPGAAQCIAGETRECTCGTADATVIGAQTCTPDGSAFDACSCDFNVVLTAQPPAKVIAGAAFRFVVELRNARGDRLDDSRDTVRLATSTGDAIEGETDRRADGGRLVVDDVALTRAGDTTLVISSRGQSIASRVITVAPAAPAKLAFDAPLPMTIISGVAIRPPPRVLAFDTYDNPADATITLALASTSNQHQVIPLSIAMVAGVALLDPVHVSGPNGMIRLVLGGSGIESLTSGLITIEAADPAWALWPMPDSTSFCGDTIDHSEAQCTPQVLASFGLQDGFLVSPAPAYEDFGTHFRDSVTGLFWSYAVFSERSRDQAFTTCAALSYGGLTWRLPTRIELVSVSDFGAMRFSGTFYTMHTASSNPNFNQDVYIVNNFGAVTGMAPVGPSGEIPRARVRCVGGAPPLVETPANPDRAPVGHYQTTSTTVLDTRTRLMWQRNHAGFTLDWVAAIALCDNATTAGFDDWRLPNIKELSTLVNERVTGRTLDLTAFPDPINASTQTAWSSTPGWTTDPVGTVTPVNVDPHAAIVDFLSRGDTRYLRLSSGVIEYTNGAQTLPAQSVRCVRNQ